VSGSLNGVKPRASRQGVPLSARKAAGDEPSADASRRVTRHQFLKKRSIYLLPNSFTTAALFCGFFSIVQAMNLHFDLAAIAIFVAMVLDGMDGRVARMTHTQSAFGEQFDSLSDMVSFGVAPALVVYECILHELGRWGWMAAFIYCAGAALRLARFNTNITVVDKRFFQGLPSPSAAALVAGFVWLATSNNLPLKGGWLPWAAFALTIYAGVTMVSNAPFYSGKVLNVRYRIPFVITLLIVLLFLCIASNPPLTLFGLFVLYGLSGYVFWAYQTLRGRSNPVRATPLDDKGKR
jgi:CDP-diacylglycerol--serine O-phosphatidyltransferase